MAKATNGAEAKLRRIQAKVHKGANAGVYAGADYIRAAIQHSIVEGSVSGKNHVPSLPGEPPNADTRQLDTNIVVRPYPDRFAAAIVAEAPSDAPKKPKSLEYGTKKMKARPFMRPGFRNNKKEAKEIIRRSVDKAIKDNKL